MHPLGRAGEAACFGDRAEVSEVPQFHAPESIA
jgi:hypothetical protein